MAFRYLAAPDNDRLEVKGTSLTPQVSRSPSPDSFSDSGTERSEDYTVLDGVKEMNEMLLMQIQAIRRQIEISEKAYTEEKAKLLATKNSEIEKKENEISKLKSSLQHKDEDIHKMKKVGAEKDKLIQGKTVEVDNLKKMVQEIQEKALKIQKKVKKAQSKNPGGMTDDNRSGSPRNEEFVKLRIEMGELKTRLATLEDELAKAIKVIEEQNEQIRNMGEDKQHVEAKLTETLNKMAESMRRHVERTCLVLQRNNEEMQELKQQNNVICEEVSLTRSHLEALIERGDIRISENIEDVIVDQAPEKPISKEHARSVAAKPTGKLPAVGSKMATPQLHRQDSPLFTRSVRNRPAQLHSSYNAGRTRPHTGFPLSGRATQIMSDDSATRRDNQIYNSISPNITRLSVQNLDAPVGGNINRRHIIPPIAQRSQQGKPLSSARGGVTREFKK